MTDWTGQATTNLLRLAARQGSPELRAAAADVVAGRHGLRDLAYLHGEPSAGMTDLLARWDRTSESDRAALAADNDHAMARIVDAIATATVDAADPAPEPKSAKATDEDDYFTENRWFPEPESF